jgi:hypothetical protein
MDAFLALWNGIDTAGLRDEYEAWHTMEHVPERVGLPGFLWGSRYRGGADGGSYFTVYGLCGLEALDTRQYADVIEHPTPWSARMRPHLAGFVRRPCLLHAQAGASSASHLVTVRVVTTDPAGWCSAASVAVVQAENTGRLVRATAGIVPPARPLAYPVGGERIAEAVPGQTTVVLLAEHCEADLATAGAQWLCGQLAAWCGAGAVVESFMLQSHVACADLPQHASGRLPPRMDLMSRYVLHK